MLRVCPLLDQSSFHCSPEKTPTQNELQAGLTTEFNVRCRRRREVIAFDLATKLTGSDGDTAMDEEESLAQHGFADYTLAPREGFLTAGRLLRVQFSTATAFSSRVFNVFFCLPVMAS